MESSRETQYLDLEKELLDAAQEGSVETLRKLLDQDKLILHRYMSGGFKETPLHIAAMFGQLEFTKLVLLYTPQMAEELDHRNSTPLHVATAHGHLPVVKELFSIRPQMCFAKDWNGRNPVHMAVIKGRNPVHTKILKELVGFKPEAARDRLGASTILHLCVKHYQMEALKYILETFPDDADFVNEKDDRGYTVLHLAVAEKQTEVVKFLLEHSKVEVDAKNDYGFTALDISLAQDSKEVAECFQQTGGGVRLSTRVVIDSNSNKTRLTTGVVADSNSNQSVMNLSAHENKRERKSRLEATCDTLMIVASLIATVTFQAMSNPPNDIEKKENFQKSNNFMLFNTISFSASIGIILILISGLPLKRKFLIWPLRIIMWIAVLSALATYYFVEDIVTGSIHNNGLPVPSPGPSHGPYRDGTTEHDSSVGLVIIISMIGIAVPIFSMMVRCLLRWMTKRRGRGNSNARPQNYV